MPKINAGLACPLCDVSGITNELYQVTPGLVVECNSGHRWTDTSALRAANPRRLEVAKRADIVQPNHVAMSVMVPGQTEAALRAKYGDKFSSTLSALLQAASEPEMIVMTASDLDRIQERLGFKPKSSSELFGRIFQMGEEIKSLQTQLEGAKRTAAVRKKGAGEGIIIDLGTQLPKAVAKAEEGGYEIEDWIGEYVRMSLENDWITINQ